MTGCNALPTAPFPSSPVLIFCFCTASLTQVHDFSKYMYAAAGLLPDMVRAVPAWIDDADIQRALYMNVLMRELHLAEQKGAWGRVRGGTQVLIICSL